MMTEVKGADKTNNSSLSAYIGTVRLELCSKSKCLAQQAFFAFYPTSVKNHRFLPPSPQGEGYFLLRILTVDGASAILL